MCGREEIPPPGAQPLYRGLQAPSSGGKKISIASSNQFRILRFHKMIRNSRLSFFFSLIGRECWVVNKIIL